jgi:hypothetical protein
MWDYFKTAKEVAQSGINWGKTQGAAILEKGGQLKDAAVEAATNAANAAKQAAVDAANAAKDAALQAAKKAKDAVIQGANTAKNAALEAAAATKKAATEAAQYVGDKVNAGVAAAQQGAKNVIGSASAGIAEYGTKKAVADPATLDKLQSGLDKRDQFSGATCAECAEKGASKHPDAQDGKFMGKDCVPSATKPAEGKKPTCDAADPGHHKFPQITLTNGINNTPKQVCETMQLLADSRCAEVFAIYNATYANQETIKAPSGTDWSDFKKGIKNLDLQQVKDGALKGVLGLAGNQGMVADVVDCIDTIKGGRDEAASKLLRDEIVKSLSGTNPQGMTIYAHSQGGLNAQAALDLATGKLLAKERLKFARQGMSPSEASAAADASVLEKLKKLDVSTFGTVEKGFVDGPTYTRYTNDYDPVPKVIREAQRGVSPDQLARDPTLSPDVDNFSAAPSVNPMAAHGMNETYIPRMNKTKNMGPCC